MGRTILALSACLLLVADHAVGQGFGIYEQGTCVMARGGGGVAEPCDDGSAVYVNPAGLSGGSRLVLGGGGLVIVPSSRFRSDAGLVTGLDSPTSIPPHLYVKYRVSSRATFGAGVFLPYGLGVRWPLDFEGRFISYDSKLMTFYVQPALAYALSSWLSVGGGLVWATSSVKLTRREDLASVPLNIPGLTFGALVDSGTDFLDTKLSASKATGFAANLGAIVTLSDRFRVGARYLTSVRLHYDGRAAFVPMAGSYPVTKTNVLGLPVGTPLESTVSQIQAAFEDQAASTAITMPAQLMAGVSVHATPKVTVFGDYQWVRWSAFDTVAIDFAKSIPPAEQLAQDYRDTSAIRVGTELNVSPEVKLRGGYVFNQAAAPDQSVTPLLPEAKRNHVTAGLGWRLRPALTVDLAYQLVHHADRRGRVVEPPRGERPTTSLNSGVYSSRGNLFGITVSYRH